MSAKVQPVQPLQLDRVQPHQRSLVEPQGSLLGTTLCDKAENIYKNVQLVSTFVASTYKQPTRSFNAMGTLVTGVGQLCSGNPFGLFGVASGGRELYNLSSRPSSPQLQSMLGDIRADAEMIGILAKGQENHHHIIGDNLKSIKKDVNELTGKLREIQSINNQGISEIQTRQRTALTLNMRAIESYERAEELFAQAQRANKHSHAIFDKFTYLFNQILNLVRKESIDVFLLEKTAKQAVSSCKNGQTLLNRADEKFKEAFTALREANALKSQAMQELALAAQQAEDAFKAGLEKSQYTQKCSEAIQSTQHELEKAKKGIKNMLRLVDSLKKDVVKANAIAKSQWGNAEFFSGVIGGVAASAVTGPVGAVCCGWASASLMHYKDRLVGAVKSAHHYLAGSFPEPAVMLKQGEVVRAVFADTSSGYWGAFRGRSSHTVGTVFIDLGNGHTVKMPFNLQDEQPVSKVDLLDLLKLMGQKLQDRSMTPKHFQDVLNTLNRKILIEGEERSDDPLQIDYLQILKPDNDLQGIIETTR